MPVIMSNKKFETVVNNSIKNALKESSNSSQLALSSLANTPYQELIANLGFSRYGRISSNSSGTISDNVKQAMLKDAMISRVINMWISDTLQKDILTKETYLVDVAGLGDIEISDEQISTIKDCIDYLRNNSNLDDTLTSILYQVIVYGNCTTKLGFVDRYEDTKIKLFESNKNKILNETASWDKDKITELLEAPNYDDYKYDENTKRNKKIVRLSGRYYLEILPHRLVPLNHKGITVLYLDLSNTNKVLNPKNITSFINRRGNTKTIALKQDSEDVQSEVYTLDIGESFIDNAVTPWSMLQSVEDCTMLALMTRSAIYRLFQVDVGAMSTTDTEKFIQEFKSRLQKRESINIRENYYSATNTQLPLGDSIIIPTRNGIGTINLQTVGNDLSIDTDNPLKYFRQQLLAALGIPEGLIYGDTGNGGLINTSAVKQDIRYLRTIQQFTSILSRGLEDIFKDYLKMIGIDITNIDIKVNFAQINNEDDLDRIELEQTKQDALSRVIDSLSSLGITFDNGQYSKTREILITRYLDGEILDAIKEDEENGDFGNPSDNQEKPSGNRPPINRDFSTNIDIDNMEEPSTEEPNEENTEISEETPSLNLDNLANNAEEPIDQTEI